MCVCNIHIIINNTLTTILVEFDNLSVEFDKLSISAFVADALLYSQHFSLSLLDIIFLFAYLNASFIVLEVLTPLLYQYPYLYHRTHLMLVFDLSSTYLYNLIFSYDFL
jgi:hypothetical protein